MKIKLTLLLLLVFFCNILLSQHNLTVEAPSDDPTLVVRGKQIVIDVINKNILNKVFILDKASFNQLSSAGNVSGVFVDDNSFVVATVEGSNISLPVNAVFFVGTTKKEELFFLTQFKLHDIVKIRKNNELVPIQSIFSEVSINLNVNDFTTVNTEEIVLSGQVANHNHVQKLKLRINGQDLSAPILKTGRFSFTYTLTIGANYLNIELFDNVKVNTICQKQILVFRKNKDLQPAQKVLWVEQFPNAKFLTNQIKVDAMLLKAKEASFTTIAFDVKGPEGFVSYRKNNLSKTPYFTETINPNKKVIDDGFDLLQALIIGARKQRLEIIVSFNFFTEGNLLSNDYAVLKSHPDWEEVIQHPFDKGKLMKLSESTIGQDALAGKRLALAFVNPLREDVQQFQLKRVSEVLQNYDIDGIVLDRTRFDNHYADFSEESKIAFGQYLQKQSKVLTSFPDDAFKIDTSGVLVKGQFYLDWITFRSTIIKDFSRKVRETVDQHNTITGKKVQLAAYVGSWYEVYYQNGVNWAGKDFKYHPALKFPEEQLYTPEYNKTSYLEYLDFLMIGTYYKTDQEIEKYITLGNTLTNGALPLIASISLPDLQSDNLPIVLRSAIRNSSGIMIFDLCYVKWDIFLDQFKVNTKE